MKFTDIFIRRPVLAISISLLIVILGLHFKLAVREYPKMTTTAQYRVDSLSWCRCRFNPSVCNLYTGRSNCSGNNIDYISSSSAPNSSAITVKMKLNTQDPNAALADILAKVNSVRSKLPKNIEDPVITSSSGGTGMMYQFDLR